MTYYQYVKIHWSVSIRLESFSYVYSYRSILIVEMNNKSHLRIINVKKLIKNFIYKYLFIKNKRDEIKRKKYIDTRHPNNEVVRVVSELEI